MDLKCKESCEFFLKGKEMGICEYLFINCIVRDEVLLGIVIYFCVVYRSKVFFSIGYWVELLFFGSKEDFFLGFVMFYCLFVERIW